MSSIRVAIVDDDGLIRDGLGAILETQDDIELVGAASDGDSGIALCDQARPQIVLMDIRMPGLDGVSAAAQIKERWPEIKIMMLTTFRDDAYIRSAIALGAEGYILKSSPADAIVESIRAVHRGATVLQSDVARTVGSMLSRGVDPESLPAGEKGATTETNNDPNAESAPLADLGLSPREQEILTLIAEGLSNKEIAASLNLSDGTVRNYISEMLVKTDVRDRTQLAILYYKSLR